MVLPCICPSAASMGMGNGSRQEMEGCELDNVAGRDIGWWDVMSGIRQVGGSLLVLGQVET